MINLFNAQIESLSVHKIGNKSRNESMVLSETPMNLTDEFRPYLKEFFFKPFRESEENYYEFAHDVSMEFNTMYMLCAEIFKNPHRVHEFSKQITHHLFDQSNHPHIKNGEVYVAFVTNVALDDKIVNAIGVFKSETKKDFLQFRQEQNNIELMLKQGVSLEKLDKGCLIFETEEENGYKLMSVDSNRYDARYWLEHFLSVDVCQDENFLTKKYLKFIEGFAKDVVRPAEDKKEEVLFINRSVDYFAKNDTFEETKFLNEVMENPEFIPEFKNYKVENEEKYSITDVSNFPISNTAVSEARKKFKSKISLDTGVEIKINLINPDKANSIIEKGWDEERQMYYYLVYFNKEQK